MKHTRMFSVLLALCLLFSSIAAGAQATDVTTYFDDIEPLAEATTLNVGIGAGILHDFPAYLAWKVGAYDKLNLKSELQYFPNGPLMIEAMKAGALDVAGSGVGGLLAGTVQGVIDILQIRVDEAVVQKYLVRKDSAIANDGINDAGFLGSAESWSQAQMYLPAGTTLQYLGGVAMGSLGLSLDSLNTVFMDANNVNTAIYAGQGDAWALWNLYGYAGALSEDYVEAFSGKTLGINFASASFASKAAMADPALADAVRVWVEGQFAVIEWMQESPENMQAAVDYYYEWCQEEGIMAAEEDIFNYMSDVTFFTREENIALLSERNEDGLLPAEEMLLSPMDFFISQGNYTEADKEKLLDGDFNPVVVKG